jgi:hypothetical protein
MDPAQGILRWRGNAGCENIPSIMAVVRILSIALLALCADSAWTHPMMGAITWNRHVSRIVYSRCLACHRDGGTAFPLLEYRQAREAAEAIKSAVLTRTMPPWGAVKGFGDLRGDEALSATEIDMIVEWVDTGTPRGNNPLALPEEPTHVARSDAFVAPRGAIAVRGETTLAKPARIAGLWPEDVSPDASLQIVAESPDGGVVPLVWLHEYEPDYTHAFWFSKPLVLARGTVIRGVPDDARVLLIPDRGRGRTEP